MRSALWQTKKLSHHKTAKVLVVTFSDVVNQGDAQNIAAYHLVAAGKDKKFGTKDDKTVPLTSATYSSGGHTVTLTTKGTVPNQPLQLNINPALVQDAEGRPISGNHMLTLGKGRDHSLQHLGYSECRTPALGEGVRHALAHGPTTSARSGQRVRSLTPGHPTGLESLTTPEAALPEWLRAGGWLWRSPQRLHCFG